MSVSERMLANVIPILLVLSLALLSAQVSFRVKSDKAEEAFHAELDTLRGRPELPQWQNRILAPALLSIARQLLPPSVAGRSVWYLSRFVEAALAYVVLYAVVLGITGGRLRALLAVGLVAYAYLWTTMSHPWEISNDFFDVMFTALIVGLALGERYVLLLLVVILAAMNRQSAASPASSRSRSQRCAMGLGCGSGAASYRASSISRLLPRSS